MNFWKTVVVVCCFLQSIALVMSPAWSALADVKTGTNTLFTNATSGNYTFTLTFRVAFNTSTLSGFAGTIQVEADPSASLFVGYRVGMYSMSSTNFSYDVNLYNSTVLSKFVASFLIWATDTVPALKLSTSSYGVNDTTNYRLNVGSGYRYLRLKTTASLFALMDISHDIVLMPFANGIQIYRNSTSDQFSYSKKSTGLARNATSTYFTDLHQTSGNNLIFYVAGTVLAVDRTLLSIDPLNLIDLKFFVGRDQQGTPLNITSYNMFVGGVNAFNMSANGLYNFTFNSATSIVESNYQDINMTTVNILTANCSYSTAIYYMSSTRLCLSSCGTGWTFNTTNNVCVACGTGCYTCSYTNTSACTSCYPDSHRSLNGGGVCTCNPYYWQDQNGTCSWCGYSCQSCLALGLCTSCSSLAYRVLNGSSCQCIPGYIDLNVSTCLECRTILSNCSECTSINDCVRCDIGYFLRDGNCTSCLLLGRYCTGCSASGCTACPTGMQLQAGICLCSQPNVYNCTSDGGCVEGFSLSLHATCQEVCGDGRLFTLECDDGNTLSGDGCSSKCLIETNYTCSAGNISTPSKCSYNQPLQITLLSITKKEFENSVSVGLTLSPVLKVLERMDFGALVTTNLPASLGEARYNRGSLNISLHYTEDIQGKDVVLMFNPPTNTGDTFDMKASSVNFKMIPSDGVATYYPSNLYESSKDYGVLLKICVYIGLVVFLVGLAFWRLVGMQLMHFLQVLCLSQYMIAHLHPFFMEMSLVLPAVNGYNGLCNGWGMFSNQAVPIRLIELSLRSFFVENFNFMLLLDLAVAAIGLVLLAISKNISQTAPRRKRMKAVVRATCEVAMTLGIFNALNVGFSLGINLIWSLQPDLEAPAKALDAIAIIIALVLFGAKWYFCIKHNEYFKHTNKSLNEDTLSRLYPVLLCAFRMLLGLLIGSLGHYNMGCIAPFILSLGWATFTIIRPPFKRSILLLRFIQLFNEVFVCFLLLFPLMYNAGVDALAGDESGYMDTTASAILTVTFLGVLSNTSCVGYSIYLRLVDHRKKKIKISVPAEQHKVADPPSAEIAVADAAESRNQPELQTPEPSFEVLQGSSIIFTSSNPQVEPFDSINELRVI